jgi:hypothetical protein
MSSQKQQSAASLLSNAQTPTNNNQIPGVSAPATLPPSGGSVTSHSTSKKRRPRKSTERFPRLTVLGIQDETIVECEMEILPKTVTFTFHVHEANPVEIARDLVSNLIFYLMLA